MCLSFGTCQTLNLELLYIFLEEERAGWAVVKEKLETDKLAAEAERATAFVMILLRSRFWTLSVTLSLSGPLPNSTATGTGAFLPAHDRYTLSNACVPHSVDCYRQRRKT